MDMNMRNLGIIAEKDKDSRIIKCNHAMLAYAGVKTDEKILGFTDYDFPWQEYADVYRQHELEILEGNDHSIIFPFKDFTGEKRIFLHTKAGLRDADNNIIGIVGQAKEIVNLSSFQFFSSAANNFPSEKCIFTLNKKYPNDNLTKREKEILFLLVRGKTAKTIAKQLDASPRTVNCHIDNIKLKLNCKSKTEVIDKAFATGLAQHIPEIFIQ